MTKNRKRAQLPIKISVFNVFAMYALDSAHEKVRRTKQSRSSAIVFEKPGQIHVEWQIDPNISLPNLVDSKANFTVSIRRNLTGNA